jgi:putative transposase
MVHYDPRNLSQVYLETPDGEIWPIPYKDPRRPPISHWEHSRACQALRVQGREEYDEELIFDTIARQREIIADSISKTKQARRTAQRIMNDLSFDASILRRSMALPGPIATPSLPAPAPAGLPLRGFDIDDD